MSRPRAVIAGTWMAAFTPIRCPSEAGRSRRLERSQTITPNPSSVLALDVDRSELFAWFAVQLGTSTESQRGIDYLTLNQWGQGSSPRGVHFSLNPF